MGVLVVLFAVVPHRLALLVEGRRGSTTLRDLVLVGWVVAMIGAVSWTLVRLQRRKVF